MAKQNYYEFFGLKNFEDDQFVIKKAYRSMALKWHPDRNQDKVNAEHMMKQVNEVYRILSTCKKSYDSHIGRNGQRNNNQYDEEWLNNWMKRAQEQMSSKAWDDLEKKYKARRSEDNQPNWYAKYTEGNFTYAEADKNYKPGDAFTGKKSSSKREKDNNKIQESSLYEQQQAIDELKTWTWDEFTIAKRNIKMKRQNGFT